MKRHWTELLREEVENHKKQAEEEKKIRQSLCTCIQKILESPLSETKKLEGIQDLVNSLTQGKFTNGVRFMASLVGVSVTEFLEISTKTTLEGREELEALGFGNKEPRT